jgi:hypothetical protein
VPEMVNTLIVSARTRGAQLAANQNGKLVPAGFCIWQTPRRALPDQAIIVLRATPLRCRTVRTKKGLVASLLPGFRAG